MAMAHGRRLPDQRVQGLFEDLPWPYPASMQRTAYHAQLEENKDHQTVERVHLSQVPVLSNENRQGGQEDLQNICHEDEKETEEVSSHDAVRSPDHAGRLSGLPKLASIRTPL